MEPFRLLMTLIDLVSFVANMIASVLGLRGALLFVLILFLIIGVLATI